MESKEWRLVDKWGELHYKEGTKYEVASYCLENQMMMFSDDDERELKDDFIMSEDEAMDNDIDTGEHDDWGDRY